MKISKKKLEESGKSVEVRKYGRVQERILKYLRDHNDEGFQQKDISDVMGISEQQSRLTLMKLVEKGLVERKELPITKEYENSKGEVVKRTYFGIFYYSR